MKKKRTYMELETQTVSSPTIPLGIAIDGGMYSNYKIVGKAKKMKKKKRTYMELKMQTCLEPHHSSRYCC